MKYKSSDFLRVGSYERTVDRKSHSNGAKDKTLNSRVGEPKLKIPQVRDLKNPDTGFYPKLLERPLRSERALKLALSEMYAQGVSTWRATEIPRQLCSLDVSSSGVSRATKILNEELQARCHRSMRKVPYLILDAMLNDRQTIITVDLHIL